MVQYSGIYPFIRHMGSRIMPGDPGFRATPAESQ